MDRQTRAAALLREPWIVVMAVLAGAICGATLPLYGPDSKVICGLAVGLVALAVISVARFVDARRAC